MKVSKQIPSVKPTKRWNSNPNPNLKITHPTLLLIESCNSMHQLKQIQARMTRSGLISHLFPVSRLLSFAALDDQNGDIYYATKLFTQIPFPNTYIYNTMIKGHVGNHSPEMGLLYFQDMVSNRIETDKRTYVYVLKACEKLSGVCIGSNVHCRIWKVGLDDDLIVRNELVHFYGEMGRLEDARKVFDESSLKDVVSWTIMIGAYVKGNLVDEAFNLFELMCKNNFQPNEVTMITMFGACTMKGDLSLGEAMRELVDSTCMNWTLNLVNAMLDMYVKCGGLDKAREIFERMERKDVFSWTSMINGYAKNGEVDLARKCFDEMPHRNVVSWNAMIAGYSQNNRPSEALELFFQMEQQGLLPMESTLVSVLSACAQAGCLDLGHRIHDFCVKQKRIRLSVILSNALIDMYAKCGSINAAAGVFREMMDRDLVSWNSIIIGYASHGHGEKALFLFEQMRSLGYKPDEITFVGLLSACAHRGLVDKGREYFRSMERDFGLMPSVEHYACMIDLLGRVGLLEEAYDWITGMPIQPDKAIWGALLNGCKMYGNVELGKLAAEKLISLDPMDSGIYALLASLCASERKWRDVSMVRSLMRDKGVKKNPGCSSIEVEGEFHEFLVADESHPRSKAIYKTLYEIFLLSRLENYGSESSLVEDYS